MIGLKLIRKSNGLKKKNILITPTFWFCISVLYFIVLLGVVWFYNPDFLQLQNMLWFLPLYGSVFFAFYLKYIDTMNITTFRLLLVFLMVVITVLVLALGLVLNFFR